MELALAIEHALWWKHMSMIGDSVKCGSSKSLLDHHLWVRHIGWSSNCGARWRSVRENVINSRFGWGIRPKSELVLGSVKCFISYLVSCAFWFIIFSKSYAVGDTFFKLARFALRCCHQSQPRYARTSCSYWSKWKILFNYLKHANMSVYERKIIILALYV